jgi:C1A family cysteine protease
MFSKKTFIIGAIALVALVGTFCVFDADSSELRIIRFKGPVEKTWESWKRQHNKTYGGPEEKARLNVFKNNYKFIQAHNAKNKNYTLALNQFADLTTKEFSALYTGASTAFRKQSNDCPAPSLKRSLNRPDTLDWRTQNRVGPVKNQAQCGSCWAFSTTGSLEGLASKTSGQIPSFSEQQLVDCTTGTWGNFGCGGGWVQNSFAYVLQKGIGLQADYPYKGVDGTCQDSKITNPFKISGCANVAVNDVEALKDAVQNGPVAIYLEADQMSFQFYSGGVLDDASCFAEGFIDHAVLLVGYDTTSWFVKNSWAASWGDKGYIKISQETTTNPSGICGILSTPNTYPL